jgi:hypothetical protein
MIFPYKSEHRLAWGIRTPYQFALTVYLGRAKLLAFLERTISGGDRGPPDALGTPHSYDLRSSS